jgi:hypothetical protein
MESPRKDGLHGFFWPREPYLDDVERDDYAVRIWSAYQPAADEQSGIEGPE